jgi:hypothetical protein
MSSHPSNQALAQSLLEHQFTNEEKQMMTPEAYSSLSSARGGNISPEAINRMIYRQPVTGAPAMRMGNTTASGAPVNVVNAAGQPVIGQPGGLTSADKQQPRIIENPDGSTTAIPPSGTPVNLKNPTSEGAETAVKNLSETLEEGRGRTRAFQSVAPIVTTMMKLADIEKNNLGWGAAQITEARQLAKRLGVSDDKANDISNIQTLMKYALTPAIETARSLTTRPSQMEFMKTLEASAADPKVDARAALNIFRGFLVNGLNATETHNKNLGIAEGMPSMKANVPVYKVPEMGDEDKLAESVLGRLGEKGAPSFHFERDKNGVWYDKGVVDDPQAKIEADKKNNLVTKTLPNGKAAYKNPANGKWYDNPEFK